MDQQRLHAFPLPTLEGTRVRFQTSFKTCNNFTKLTVLPLFFLRHSRRLTLQKCRYFILDGFYELGIICHGQRRWFNLFG